VLSHLSHRSVDPSLLKVALLIVVIQDLIHRHLRAKRRHHQRNRRASTGNHGSETDQSQKRVDEHLRYPVALGGFGLLMFVDGVELVRVGEEALETGKLGCEPDGSDLEGFVDQVEPVRGVLHALDVDVGVVENTLGQVSVWRLHVFAAADELYRVSNYFSSRQAKSLKHLQYTAATHCSPKHYGRRHPQSGRAQDVAESDPFVSDWDDETKRDASLELVLAYWGY